MNPQCQTQSTSESIDLAKAFAPRTSKLTAGALTLLAAPAVFAGYGQAAETAQPASAPAVAASLLQDAEPGVESEWSLAWDRYREFLDSLYTFNEDGHYVRKNADEVDRLMKEFYATLTSTVERQIGALQLGGKQYFRPDLPRSTSIEVLEELIVSAEPEVQAEALGAAERLQASDCFADRILELSQVENPTVHRSALLAMDGGIDVRFTERLLQTLVSEQIDVRELSVHVLGRKTSHPGVLTALQTALEDPASSVRQAAVSAAAAHAFGADTDLRDKLLMRLFDSDVSVVYSVLDAVRYHAPRVGDRDSVIANAVAAKLGDQNTGISARAANTLAQLGSKTHFPFLRAIIADESWPMQVRTSIIWGIHIEDGPEFTPLFLRLLETPDLSQELRHAVEFKLRYLEGS